MCGKKLSLILVVLLLVCSSLCAWPTRKTSVTQVTPEEPMVVVEKQENTLPTKPLIQSVVKQEPLESSPVSLEKASEVVDPVVIADLIDEKLDKIDDNTAALKAYIETLEEERNELLELNNAQADTIAYNDGLMAAEKRAHAFVKAGGIMSFDEKLNYGLSASIGLRKGSFIMEVGAQQMLPLSLSLKNTLFTASIGFEF